MRKFLAAAALMSLTLAGTSRGYSQKWSLGGNLGMSTFDGSFGFHVTPMAEVLLNRNMGVGTELSINTQEGTPLLLYMYFKYYFRIHGSRWKPYAYAGPEVAFDVPNAPGFGVLFGSGVDIPVGGNLYLAPDIVFGPVFDVGSKTYNLFLYGNYYGMGAYGASSYTVPGGSVFVFFIRAGIRYEL